MCIRDRECVGFGRRCVPRCVRGILIRGVCFRGRRAAVVIQPLLLGVFFRRCFAAGRARLLRHGFRRGFIRVLWHDNLVLLVFFHHLPGRF